MIRRNGQDSFLLITQNEHASLSGKIASHWGNENFPYPEPRSEVVKAIETHDAGWSLHDDKPVLNSEKIPATFYEMPFQWYIRVWVASVSAAAARGGPMGGLLVSWYLTSLAKLAPIKELSEAVRLHLEDFLSAQHARQVDYCKTLCLSSSMYNDPPHPANGRDHGVMYNYYLLRICDLISLQLCSDAMPETIHELAFELSLDGPDTIKISRADEQTLCLEPWPLDVDTLPLKIQGLRIPNGRYRREVDLLRVCEQADKETLSFSLSAPVA